jgi:nucleoside-diphosphate-sugar epimerase
VRNEIKCKSSSRRVLITGAGGFLGRSLSKRLNKDGYLVTALSRDKFGLSANVDSVNLELEDLMRGHDLLVHLAARVHITKDCVREPIDAYRSDNVDLTLNLARFASRAGIRRFVFISSVKVNGDLSVEGRPFSSTDEPKPNDPYALSKFEAEVALTDFCKRAEMELVIIRPPLVYGPGARANFAALLLAVHRGMPLPLAGVQNKRSQVAVDNVVDLIALCLIHRLAPGKVWMVSDGEDLSTSQLIQRLATAMGRSPRLFYMPIWLLKLLGIIFGKSGAVSRLTGNLQVNMSETLDVLGWKPPVSLDEGLRRTALSWTENEANF